MTFRKVRNSITAALISAVMSTTVLASPIAFQMTQVTAADQTVNIKLEATDSEEDDAPNRMRAAVPAGTSSVTFNFETDYEGEISFGVFGLELSKAPYWADVEESFKVKPKDGKGSITYKIPEKYKKDVKKVCLGMWYPKEGLTVNITSISHDGAVTGPDNPDNPDKPGPQTKPATANTKSGEWSFVPNDDGTATITSTLTAELPQDAGFPYTLTAGYDEEKYLDANGNSTWEEGKPINSQKFSFGLFGIGELENVNIQSFNYTIESDEEMNKLQYGGGINVEQMSPADTEYAKGKNGYWYNDQGTMDVDGGEDPDTGEIIPGHKEELDALGIKYNIGGYEVENAGTYAEIVWDVPKDVQPYVSKNPTDTVGIQFWYADAANPPEGEDYAAVSEVRLTAASCTYTRTLTVPYNNSDEVKIGKTLTPGSDEATNQYKFKLNELGLKERDKLSAVKFNVSSSADLKKFTGGVGISVGGTKGEAIGNWYMPGNITVLEPKPGKFEIMWIIPQAYRDDIDLLSDEGNLMFGAWYAGEDSPTITLDSITAYEFLSKEEALTVTPEKFELNVGEVKKIKTNVDGCTFSVVDEKYATVSDDGTVKGVADGLTKIIVTTPEGQEKEIIVIVNDTTTTPPPTTAKTTTTTKTTTTKTTTKPPVTTTVDPNEVIDWSRVKYGDVNLDKQVDIADVVKLNLYLLDNEKNYINATARENADCAYDKKVALNDAGFLMSYTVETITYDKVGPQGDQVPAELKQYLKK